MDEETVEEQVIDEEQIVEHQEVLEEVVTTEEVFNENGEIVQYEDIVVYEEGNQEIVEEEYVDLHELQDGEEYTYMITDENGQTRYIPATEMRELVDAGQVLEGVVEDEVTLKDEKSIVSEQGPSQPRPRTKKTAREVYKRSRMFEDMYSSKTPTLRDLVETITENTSKNIVYMDGGEYYDNHGNMIVTDRSGLGQVGPKRAKLNDMAKVDVEKHIHQPNIVFRSPIERPTHKTTIPYFGPSTEKRRKLIHPISIEEIKDTVITMKPQPTPVDSIDASQYQYRCPECEEIHNSLDKLCSHLASLHDIPAQIQQTEMYDDSEFNKFLMSIEKSGCTPEELEQRFDKKKSKQGMSQFFRCNYMFKSRDTNYAEMVDFQPSQTNEVEETCPAFVLKVQTYDSLRVRYCDLHVHADANVGFRVPIAIKRRLMEWLYKRIPIPVMQMLLISEADKMSHGGKVEQQLRDLSTNQLATLLSKIHNNFTLYEKLRHQQINPEDISNDSRDHVIYAEDILMKPHHVDLEEEEDKRKNLHKIEVEDQEEQQPKSSKDVLEADERMEEEEEEDNEGAPILERADPNNQELIQPKVSNEPILECEEDQPATYDECLTISIPENLLYDPEIGNDVVIDEVSEIELKFLEAYESDAQIALTDKQQVDRNRRKLQFLQNAVMTHFSNIDSLTHGMTHNDHPIEVIDELRDCATSVLEAICGIEAEIRASSFVSLPVEAIKSDLIASVSSKERRYVTSEKLGGGRRRPHMTPLMEAELKQHQQQRQHEIDEVENAIIEEDIYSRVTAMAPPHRSMGINSSGTFSLEKADVPKQSELTVRDVVMMEAGRTPKPWYKYSQRKSDVVTTRPVLEVPQTRTVTVVDSVTQLVNKAATEAKKRGRKRKDPLSHGIPEETNQVMQITTDDNVPHAIAMGVGHEVTVSTEEDESEGTTNNRFIERFEPKTETIEGRREEEVVEEEVIEEGIVVEQDDDVGIEVEHKKVEEPPIKQEEDIPVTPTVTRTGRVVKMKKWND